MKSSPEPVVADLAECEDYDARKSRKCDSPARGQADGLRKSWLITCANGSPGELFGGRPKRIKENSPRPGIYASVPHWRRGSTPQAGRPVA